ncbi:MAG TPA: nucleotide exchange factor GrpE [Armatimonadota bacterium]|jgi:molecular chaperone GrpE
MSEQFRDQEDMTPETAADIAESAAAAEGAADALQCPVNVEDAAELLVALNSCQRELAEMTNSYLRAHADFDNFRKRLRAERDQEFARGTDRVLAELLPIVDDFDRALAAANHGHQTGALRQGVELIYRQLLNLLERYNIKPFEVMDQPFDPKYHDAVSRVATTAAPEHTVIGEIQRGYLKNGDVFRPAKVAVAVAPDEPAEK